MLNCDYDIWENKLKFTAKVYSTFFLEYLKGNYIFYIIFFIEKISNKRNLKIYGIIPNKKGVIYKYESSM